MTDDLRRLREQNPDLARLVDGLRALCSGRLTYLHDRQTGRTWGRPVEPEEARRDAPPV